jgi:hypothetical protein
MKDVEELLTPSQLKLLKDQEQWMKDVGVKYDDERTRWDAAYAIQQRFPTERKAREALETYGGDPSVIYLYEKGKVTKIHKRAKSKKIINAKRKCKCT